MTSSSYHLRIFSAQYWERGGKSHNTRDKKPRCRDLSDFIRFSLPIATLELPQNIVSPARNPNIIQYRVGHFHYIQSWSFYIELWNIYLMSASQRQLCICKISDSKSIFPQGWPNFLTTVLLDADVNNLDCLFWPIQLTLHIDRETNMLSNLICMYCHSSCKMIDILLVWCTFSSIFQLECV